MMPMLDIRLERHDNKVEQQTIEHDFYRKNVYYSRGRNQFGMITKCSLKFLQDKGLNKAATYAPVKRVFNNPVMDFTHALKVLIDIIVEENKRYGHHLDVDKLMDFYMKHLTTEDIEAAAEEYQVPMYDYMNGSPHHAFLYGFDKYMETK